MAKLRKCRICHEPYQPFNSTQPTCGKQECQYQYAINHVNKARASRMKLQRAQTRADKERLKPRSKWLDEAQAAINRWIREVRDRDSPCFTCGRYADSYDCGHFRSRGAASHLRFNEKNLAKQCSRPCNLDLSGNILAFRKALIIKYGIEEVEALENDNTPHKWTVEEAKEIKEKYNKLYREFKKSEKELSK